MKDKYFDRPQKFDAEDEAFFAKHFGQRNEDGSSPVSEESAKSSSKGRTVSGAGKTASQTSRTAQQNTVSSASGRTPTSRPSSGNAEQEYAARRRAAQQQAAASGGTARRTASTQTRTGASAQGGMRSGTSRASSSSGQARPQQRRQITPEEAQRLAAERRRQRARENAANAAAESSGSRPVSSQTPTRRSSDPQQTAARRSGGSQPSRRRNVPPGTSNPPAKKRRRKKRHHWFLWLLVLIVALAVLTVALGKQPIRETAGAGTRTDGISTFVLAGTDAEGERTDTIMLVSINSRDHTTSIMSIPRDTYVDAPYSVPKINSAYGYAGGRKKGMEELLTQISRIIGYMPDGYILVDLNDFVTVVNFMGGVDFDVPMDMDYDDPTQNLSIHLKAGKQHLNGKEAIQLVRFRSGYADADLGRMSVQRDFMQAALKQWTSPLKIWRVPFLTVFIATQIRTDMSLSNLGWIGRVGLMNKIHEMRTDLLPGEPQYIGSGSYYVADESATRSLMNEAYSPYR